ncbi:MAG: LysM peptidoglycan-binding domain-containing protein [Planctomycetota bacterium]
MSNSSASPVGSSDKVNSSEVSAVGQTANIGRSTSLSGGTAKIFREFKWGLLTLFLLMVVVIGLVYDSGPKKKSGEISKTKVAEISPEINLDLGGETGMPPTALTSTGNTNIPIAQNPSRATGQRSIGPIIEVPNLPSSNQLNTAISSINPINPPIAKSEKPTPSDKSIVSATTEYVVKSGDTLTRIANEMLPGKGNVKAILEANKESLSDPNRLRVGMMLKIPNALSAAPEAHLKSTEPLKPKIIAGSGALQTKSEVPAADASEYVVQNGDTLERIARKLFNDGRKWRDLYEWNREQLSDPSRLRQGQTLKIKSVKTVIAPPTPTPTPPNSARVETQAPTHPAPAKKVASATTEPHALKPTVAKEEAAPEPRVEIMSQTSPATLP